MRKLIVTALVTATFTFPGNADPVITGISGNGVLSWTNAAQSNAFYRVEWASSLSSGTWHRTLQTAGFTPSHTNTEFSVDVPMFYRIVMATNPPPSGMVYVDSGVFQMGDHLDDEYADDEKPVHPVYLDGFYIDAKEVTQHLWEDVYVWATNNNYNFTRSGSAKGRQYPITTIEWWDALRWCNARSEKNGLTPCYYTDASLSTVYRQGEVIVSNSWVDWDANGYRLPTEAEWEKAARAGFGYQRFPWGNAISHSFANYNADTATVYDVNSVDGYHPDFDTGGEPYTAPACSFDANRLGLYDMIGNVSEWVWDWYGSYTNGAEANPRGPDAGTFKVVRGGSWYDGPIGSRVTFRNTRFIGSTDGERGFRCVRRP